MHIKDYKIVMFHLYLGLYLLLPRSMIDIAHAVSGLKFEELKLALSRLPEEKLRKVCQNTWENTGQKKPGF